MLVLKNAHVDTSALQAIARFLRQVVVGGGGGLGLASTKSA